MITAGVIFLIFIAGNVAWFACTDEWKRRGLYAWRVRKPHAFIGLPIIGRHWGYVGMTSSRYHRDDQHLFGTKSYWSDLNAKVYPLPCWFPGWERARLVQERLWTFVLWPVYPEQGNTWNPRRISRDRARAMRIARQAGGRRFNFTYALVRAPFTLALYLGLYWAGVAWDLWPGWIGH